MLECGWVLESPWKWKHEVLNFRVSLDRAAAQGNVDRDLHLLRDAWRWSLFRAFMTEDRRDSAMFRAAFGTKGYQQFSAFSGFVWRYYVTCCTFASQW